MCATMAACANVPSGGCSSSYTGGSTNHSCPIGNTECWRLPVRNSRKSLSCRPTQGCPSRARQSDAAATLAKGCHSPTRMAQTPWTSMRACTAPLHCVGRDALARTGGGSRSEHSSSNRRHCSGRDARSHRDNLLDVPSHRPCRLTSAPEMLQHLALTRLHALMGTTCHRMYTEQHASWSWEHCARGLNASSSRSTTPITSVGADWRSGPALLQPRTCRHTRVV